MFQGLFVPAEVRDAVSDAAWLQAMLDAERALALAESRAGVIPTEAAEVIAASCRAELFDSDKLAERGRAPGNPVEPLVRALRETVGGDAAQYVHYGATSQDILDTAAMLVARRTIELIAPDLAGVADACAELASTHRSTPMAARTLLQQAVPTTFGLKAAGWLVAVVDARRRLVQLRDERLAVELGGAAGTLASLGDGGLEVVRLYAEQLELPEPVVPWHASRGRIAELGAALDVVAGTLAKIALDLALLAQTEVGEVAEPAGGLSSTMPQKRNPAGSTIVAACARLVHANASVLSGGLAQEHERAIGGWHAEWEALSAALSFTGGAAARMREVLEGLDVHADRMRRNLDATDGLVMAERLAFLIGGDGHELVREASEQTGGSLRDRLVADSRVSLTPEQVDAALDPATYLGSATIFVDRALDLYRRELRREP